MKHILSFDIAKGKSVYCFIDELKNIIIKPSSIEHNKNDFDKLWNIIKNYSNLVVVMESTSIFSYSMSSFSFAHAYCSLCKSLKHFLVYCRS